MLLVYCTPERAREFLNRAGIRRESDFGQKLQEVISMADGPEDEQVVELTERERAQMILPSVLARIGEFPQDALLELFESEDDMGVVMAWPDESLSDSDYADLVDALQEFEEEMLMFLLLDSDEVDAVVEGAIDG